MFPGWRHPSGPAPRLCCRPDAGTRPAPRVTVAGCCFSGRQAPRLAAPIACEELPQPARRDGAAGSASRTRARWPALVASASPAGAMTAKADMNARARLPLRGPAHEGDDQHDRSKHGDRLARLPNRSCSPRSDRLSTRRAVSRNAAAVWMWALHARRELDSGSIR